MDPEVVEGVDPEVEGVEPEEEEVEEVADLGGNIDCSTFFFHIYLTENLLSVKIIQEL